MPAIVLTLTGIGAMRSPCFAPAGLLVTHAGRRVMIDGGGRSAAGVALEAWLVTDERCELMAEIRRACAPRGIVPRIAQLRLGALQIRPRAVRHTSHRAVGYEIRSGRIRVVWAPEFWTFPRWAARADLMFAEAAGWSRPIRFAGGVGGHAAAMDVARRAQRNGVRRLVFAHVGRPTIRAIDAGEGPPFGEFGIERHRYVARPRRITPE
jgi:hypothetical protein